MDNTDQVLEFVKRNRVKAKPGFICVDGRYKSPFYAGMLARPGGNFRGIMTLLSLRKKLGLTVGRCVDIAVDAVESMGITFNLHTDEHTSEQDLSAIGCGHIAKAEDPHFSKLYKVDPEDVKMALVYLRIKLEGRKYYKLAELEGSHKELGVLIITGEKYTVNHADPKTEEMYFVYDQGRDADYTRKLWGRFNIPKLTWKDFSEGTKNQMDATLKILAKDLPIYEINLDSKEPSVKFVGKVK